MLRSGHFPHVKAWSAVVARLAGSGGAKDAVALMEEVMARIRELGNVTAIVKDSLPDTGAFNAVLNACVEMGDVRRFVEMFDGMTEWDLRPDVLTYNVMIKLCGRAKRKDMVVEVVELMLREGVEPCLTTMRSLVAVYVGFGDLETTERLVQAMREGRRDVCRIMRDANHEVEDDGDEVEDDDDEVEVDDGYENDDGIRDDGDGWFESWMKDKMGEIDYKEGPLMPKTYAPDTRIYTTLMKGYMNVGRVADTVRMLEAMRHQSDKSGHPDEVSYTTVISAFVKGKSMDKAREVLAEMRRVGVLPNLVTYNVLLKGYCQQLQVEKAKELVHEMVKDAGISPDVVSYNTLINGCVMVDDSAGALAIFNEMRASGITPTKVSYTTLMKAFAKIGQPKVAHKVFDEMLADPRVKVDLVAWNMLVEGYCNQGLVDEAKQVVQTMREHGLYPNLSTYGSLANGIALARKPGEALLLWNEIKERCKPNKGQECNPDTAAPPPFKPDEWLLDDLADIFVRAAFFKKALEVVACMEEYGISPNKSKYSRIYVEMHSRMFTSKHASKARQDRRWDRMRAAEAFKFWLGLPNSYYGSEWRPRYGNADGYD